MATPKVDEPRQKRRTSFSFMNKVDEKFNFVNISIDLLARSAKDVRPLEKKTSPSRHIRWQCGHGVGEGDPSDVRVRSDRAIVAAVWVET